MHEVPLAIGIVVVPCFGPTCLTCVMHVRCEGSELSLFWTASEWPTKHGFVMSHKCEQNFDVITLLLSIAPLLACAIGEQWGYAALISFGLVAHHKSMLCRPLLGGFSTSFPIDMSRAVISIDVWYL
jgi:hypothetical protein